jgi:hypothetical protein
MAVPGLRDRAPVSPGQFSEEIFGGGVSVVVWFVATAGAGAAAYAVGVAVGTRLSLWYVNTPVAAAGRGWLCPVACIGFLVGALIGLRSKSELALGTIGALAGVVGVLFATFSPLIDEPGGLKWYAAGYALVAGVAALVARVTRLLWTLATHP